MGAPDSSRIPLKQIMTIPEFDSPAPRKPAGLLSKTRRTYNHRSGARLSGHQDSVELPDNFHAYWQRSVLALHINDCLEAQIVSAVRNEIDSPVPSGRSYLNIPAQ